MACRRRSNRNGPPSSKKYNSEASGLSSSVFLRCKNLSGWSLFIVASNLTLLVLATTCLAMLNSLRHSFEPDVLATAQALEMDARWSEGALSIYTHKDFPDVCTFTVGDADQEIIIEREELAKSGFLRQADYCTRTILGDSQSVGTYYSLENGKPRIREIRITSEGRTTIDINADGMPDVLAIYEELERLRSVQIFRNGAWVSVRTNGHLFPRHWTLHDGTAVIFDIDSGRWIAPETE